MRTWHHRNALLILLLVIAVAGVPHAGRAAPADAGLVLEAIQVLDREYVDQSLVGRVRLLNAALEGIRETLSRTGIAVEFAQIPSGTPAAEAERIFRERFDTALTAAGGRVPVQEMTYAAIRAMTAILNDSHTGFLTPQQYRERLARQRRQVLFAGVGMVILPKDGRFYVWQVIPGTPAERQGVRQFDRIVRVGTVATGGLTSEQVVSMIRGPSGTPVAVTFERSGRSGTFTVTITRAPIVVPSIFAGRMLEPGIGYLHLYEFQNGVSRETRVVLQRLLAQGMRVLILDLRSNSGGFLHELRAVLNLLLPPGLPVYQEASSQGTQVVRTTRVPLLRSQVPVLVLVDESTASAAELLAAAMAEHQRGTVVGMKTAGAVEGSILVELSDGSAMSVTIQRMSTGKGRRLEGTGILPDVTVELSTEDFLQGRDAQVARATQIARQRIGRTASVPAPSMTVAPRR
jgi:carboxyl-terminal processing protease